MPQTAGGNLGLQLGQLLFGGQDDSSAYLKGQLTGSQVQSAMETARLARAKALNQEGQNEAVPLLGEAAAKLGLTPEQSAGYQTLGQAGGGDASVLAKALGLIRGQGYQADARTAALGGDLNAANANLFGLADKPVDLAKITDGIAYNPTVTPDAGNLTITPLGQADIALKNAQAVKGSFVDALPLGDGTTQAGFIDPATRTFAPITRGGLGTLGDAAPTSAPMMDFATLARTTGATMTSGLRSPEHNAQVGGVPDSQHMAGTAADFAVRPEQKPAFVAQAQAMGYTAIDEGDHIHLQVNQGLGSMGGDPGTGIRVGMGGGAPAEPPTTMARAPQLAFGQAPAKATGGDTFSKNKAFADQLRASGAITTPEEYKQVLTTGKVQQSDADVHLSPADERSAEMLARYQIRPQSLGRSKNRSALIARAGEINPDFQEANANAAFDYIKDLSKSGNTSAGGRVTSINAGLQHLGAMMDANDALAGTGFTPLNAAINTFSGKTGKAAITNYELSLHLLSQEVAKLLKGGVPDVFDVNGIIKNIGPDSSPEQRNAGMATLATFLEGQISSVEQRGANILGSMDPGTSLMTEASQENVRRAYALAGRDAPEMRPPAGLTGYVRKLSSATKDPAPGATAAPVSHAVGDLITHDGKQYRVTGGDPNDPDVELVQ